MAEKTADNAAATVERWQRGTGKASQSHSAALGLRMLAGEWTDSDYAVDTLGASGGLLSQVVITLRAAGYTVEQGSRGGNAKRYRVKPTRGAGKARAARTVTHERAGTTHPQLGAVLTVRALALDEAGQLVVQLTNGNGSGWLAQITGHVEP